MKQKSKPGFTLIELLVVIAVIGLLASVVVVALNSARAKARDARRIADIRQIKTALELFSQDNGNYPSYNAGPTYYWVSDNNFPGSTGYPPCGTTGGLIPYISNVCNLKDPLGNKYAYTIYTNGQYKLGAKFELTANQGNVFAWNDGATPVVGWYELKQ